MSIKELREKDANALREELISLRQAQLKLTMQKATGQLRETHTIREVRRNIARVKTLLAQQNIKV